MNAVNVGLVTFIIQHNRIQGVFLLCKITNLLIYSYINRISEIMHKIWYFPNQNSFFIFFILLSLHFYQFSPIIFVYFFHKNTLREFLKLSQQSPKSRPSTDFDSLPAKKKGDHTSPLPALLCDRPTKTFSLIFLYEPSVPYLLFPHSFVTSES